MSAKFDIFELTKYYQDDEKRFVTLLDLLNELYAHTKEENKKKVTKTLVTQIIELYSHENSRFRSDPRLLRAWDLLGKTSNSLGYDAVMQKLDDLGYFKMCPEFYRLWAEYLVEKKDRALFEKVFARVMALFSNNKSVLNVFEGFAKEFGPNAQDEDVTVNIFKNLSTPVRDPPTRSVNAVPEEIPAFRHPPPRSINAVTEEIPVFRDPPPRSLNVVTEENSSRSGSSSSRSGNGIFRSESGTSRSGSGIFRSEGGISRSGSGISRSGSGISRVENDKMDPANELTARLHRDAVCAFGETLPLSQEVLEQPVPVSHMLNNAEKDFSVFAEEEEPMDVHFASPKLIRNNIFTNPAIRDSPVMKKARARRDSDEEIEPSFDNPFGDIGNFKRPSLAPKSVFDADKVTDDHTISGFNKQQSSSRASSTPTGGKATVPTFEVSPTATFPLANKENEPFTFAPAVVVSDVTKSPPQSKVSTLPPLSEAIGRMCLAPADDLDATTHDISVMPEAEIKSGVNPWCENERLKVLKHAPPMVNQHEFLTTKAPSLNVKGSVVELGGEKFKIMRFIAQGGFARIYKTQAEDGKQYAVKLEIPSCPWEVYICKSLSARLPQEIQPFVMSIRDAYIFSNASAIIYDYYPLKTLLDLANSYRSDNNSTLDGMVVAFIGVQIAEILNYVHQAKIIHADIKPDNFVIVEALSSELPHQQYIKPFVKLIDWGRAIDMSVYENDQTFKGRAGTNGFDCHEMQEDRPWTYQTDFFGYVGTMHVLMFGTYMKSFYNPTKKIYCFTEQLKRRYPLCETWTNIFREFLNVPDCDNMPSWEKVVTTLKQDLEDFATEDVSAWRRAVDKCNAVLRNSVN